MLFVRGKLNGNRFCFTLDYGKFDMYRKLMENDQEFVNAVRTTQSEGQLGLVNETIQTISRSVGDLEEIVYTKSPESQTSMVTKSFSMNTMPKSQGDTLGNFSSEFMIAKATAPNNFVNSKNDTEFTVHSTKFLLVKVSEYLKEVGPMKKFKTKKVMWNQISKDLKEEYGLVRDSPQCENKYKSVLKNYKLAVDKNRTSGSSRVKLPFEEEMGLIAANDDSIIPAVLASQKGVEKVKAKRKRNFIASSSEDEDEGKKENRSSPKQNSSSDSEAESEPARKKRTRRQKKLSVGEYYLKAAQLKIKEEKKWRSYKMKADEKKLRLLEKMTTKSDSE